MIATTQTYSFRNIRTYLFATAFVAGNLVLPQLAHMVPNGGLTFLPIYFFTLIAAYRYGLATGLLTAVLSPVLNSLLFGMPLPAVVPAILVKSVFLALLAGGIRDERVTRKLPRAFQHFLTATPTLWRMLILFTGVVLGYQLAGTLVEWLLVGDFHVAAQDFRIGLPGMAIQVITGVLIASNLR